MSDGRIIVVSGGSRGIGATTCRRLIEQGYCVIALSRGVPSFENLIKKYIVTCLILMLQLWRN